MASDPELSISTEKLCFIIIKAREFDAKDAVSDPDPGSNASDDEMIEVLEDHGDDATYDELVAFIGALNDDEQIDMVTLAWLGRADYTLEDWTTLRTEATLAHNRHTADYLLGMPLLADYLEEGMSLFGINCADVEREHL